MSFYHTFSIIPGEMADGKGNACVDFPQQVPFDKTAQAEMFDSMVAALLEQHIFLTGTFDLR